ncbi:hypothetical protein MP228_004109 [Amoeboaphelidium protococcarum]|nr:hypothetical protein MP228_004109 [Amoeboaphelidium protococcarum]
MTLFTDADGVSKVKFDSVQTALEEFKRGQFVIVLDDEGRENEGDLIIAAEDITREQMTFMVRHTTGIVCVPMTRQRLEQLDIPLMVTTNTDPHHTKFTVSIDYKHGTSTGVSASDRTATVRALADGDTVGDDFTRPGHIFPLMAHDNLLTGRQGHTEASLALCQLTGKSLVAVISELVRDQDGEMARRDDLIKFAKQHQLPIITVKSLLQHWISMQHE